MIISFHRAKYLKIHGVKYSVGALVRVKTSPSLENESDPFSYGQIQHMYVFNDHKIFVLRKVKVLEFVEHFRAVEVEVTNITQLCLLEDMFTHGVLHIKNKLERQYITDYHFRV